MTRAGAALVLAITGCVATTELATASPPTITALARGIAPAAVIAVSPTEVFIGETLLGARPTSVESRVRSIPTVGGVLRLYPETQDSGEITGLALAKDGTLYLSLRALPLSNSTVSAFRGGQETVVVRGSQIAPPGESLSSPAGIAVAQSGDLIVADTVGSQVLRVSLAGKVERLAGSGPCGSSAPPTPGPALDTPLCGPELLAVDGQSNIYVARKGARWIAKIDRSGVLSLVATNLEGGLATDSVGSLLVSEGTLGQIIRYRGDQSTILVTGLSRPTSLAVGSDGAIYVVAEATGDLLRIVMH